MEQATNQKSGSIVGTWKLVSLEIQRENREVTYLFGKNAQGSLIYTKSGRFSAQVMRPDRPRIASDDQPKGTPDEVKANYEGFVSYYGTYQFNRKEGLIIHHVEGSLFPNWEGQRLKRFVELSGNRLRLTTPPSRWASDIVAILRWERTG